MRIDLGRKWLADTNFVRTIIQHQDIQTRSKVLVCYISAVESKYFYLTHIRDFNLMVDHANLMYRVF